MSHLTNDRCAIINILSKYIRNLAQNPIFPYNYLLQVKNQSIEIIDQVWTPDICDVNFERKSHIRVVLVDVTHQYRTALTLQ